MGTLDQPLGRVELQEFSGCSPYRRKTNNSLAFESKMIGPFLCAWVKQPHVLPRLWIK